MYNKIDRALTMLVVEDETAATVNLLSIIAEVCPRSTVVETLESVWDTVQWLEQNPAPDVIFMDVHLADGDAFRIFELASVTSPVIFTTAYDRYALEAFSVNSIDYLLKPIKASDLHRAVDKLLRLTGSASNKYTERTARMAVDSNNKALLLHYKDKLVPVAYGDIDFLYTFGEKVTVTTSDGRTLPYDKSLDTAMGFLPEADFFRANRQFIVSRKAIADISVWFGGRLAVNLRQSAPEKIIISKVRTKLFKSWLTSR